MDIIKICQCLIIVFIICFVHVSSDVGEKKMIVDSINFCDSLNTFRESSYLFRCKEIPFPSVFKENDIDLTLCMAIFDTVNKICQTIGNKEPTITLLAKSEKLDDNIKKFEPNPEVYYNFTANLCKEMISVFNTLNSSNVQSDPKTVPYIKYTRDTLFNQQECHCTCHRPKNIVNPLCMILNALSRFKSKLDSNKNLDDSNIAININAQKESLTVRNLKNGNNISEQQKIGKIEENTSPINKISIIQSPEHNPVLNGSKIPDDLKRKNVDSFSKYNENEFKKNSETRKADDRRKQGVTVPLPVDNKTNSKTEKSSENFKDNPDNIPQQQEANSERPLILSEDHQNKKNNENKDDDIDSVTEHDNIEHDNNNLKDSISNTDVRPRNSGLLQDSKKSYPDSSLGKEEDESHFFTYFSIITLTCIGLYIGYHNKQKILAMVLEGRRSRRGRGSRRRPSTASYHKLDCNLEEAVTSQCNSNVTHVIY